MTGYKAEVIGGSDSFALSPVQPSVGPGFELAPSYPVKDLQAILLALHELEKQLKAYPNLRSLVRA